ncbi:hypothetical protein Tco_0683574, partial [Tanacetum coccineum]
MIGVRGTVHRIAVAYRYEVSLDGFWHALNGVDPAVKKLAYV